MLRIVTFLIGVIFGYIFACKFMIRDNVIYHGPDSNEVKTKIYYWKKDKKYYRFTPVPYVCPPMYINALK